MLRELLSGFDLRDYNPSVRRFFLYAILLFSGMALFSLLYNLYLLRLSYQEDFIGRMAGLFPVASGLVALPTGVLSDRFGRRPFLMASSLVLGFSQLGLCLVTHSTALLSLSFAGGIAGAFVFVNFIPFLAENASPERRSQAIAIWMSIQALTRMLVSLAGGSLPGMMGYLTGLSTDLPEPFRYALLLGGGCTLLSIVPLLGMRLRHAGRSGAEAGASSGRSKAAPTPWKHLLVFGSISGCRGLSWGFCLPFFNVFFQEQFSTSAATIGVIFFASMALGLPSTVAAPALARRLGATLAIAPFRLLGACCLGLMGWTPAFFPVVLLFLVTMAVDACTVPSEMAFATNTLPRPYWARMQSLRVAGFQILSGLGSFSAGTLILDYGYWLPFLLAGLAQAGSVTVFLIAFGYQKPHDPLKKDTMA